MMKYIHSLVHRFHNQDIAVLIIRITLGITFIHAGYLKVTHLPAVLQAFDMMGFYSWLGYLVAFAELISGVLVLSGVFVRYAALVISVIMVVAIIGVHIKNGFGMQVNGFEYPFVLLGMALSLQFTGSGACSGHRWFSWLPFKRS